MFNTFKEASRLKLRFKTDKGELSVEQLWSLDLPTLDALAVSLEKDYNSSEGKSFLNKNTKKDKTLKMKFDVVFEILETKMDEAAKATKSAERKAKNEKIMALIVEKKDESLKGKSVKQLTAMLDEDDDEESEE